MTRTQTIALIAKLLFSALLLGWVLPTIDLEVIGAQIQLADLRWLIWVLAIAFATVFLSAVRWQLLSLGLVSLGEAVRYTWIGIFFGSIVPGAVGGDIAKGISLAAKQSRTRDSRLPLSIIADKVIGLWVLLLFFNFAAAALLISQPAILADLRGAWWVICTLTACGIVAAFGLSGAQGAVLLSRYAGRLPAKFLRDGAIRIVNALRLYQGRTRILGYAALLSAAIHALNAASFWMVMRSLSIPAHFGFAAVVYPLLSVLVALPVSISGVGVRDVFVTSVFAGFGFSRESAVAFSWLLLGLSVPNVIVGGLIQLWEIFHPKERR